MIQDNNNRIKTYQGQDFIIQIPDFWEIEHPNKQATVFNGPRVGLNNTTLTITSAKTTKGGHIAATRRLKIAKSAKSNYTFVKEEDISTKELQMLMRVSTWEKPDMKLTVYNREIIITTPQKNYIVQSFIPVSPDLVVIDRLFMKFMQTFKLGRLKIKQ